MEIYKRKVGYEDLNYRVINNNLPITASSYLVTATTLYFPFMLTQNLEDIGIYTDAENPTYEIVDFSGFWNLSNTGVGQSPCLTLNNCTINFTSTPITFYNANNGSISASILGCPGPQTISWTGPNGFTSTNLTINSLASGNYTIKVTDSNCNITYASYFLTQPQSLSFNLNSTNSKTNATSPGGCDGTASVVAQGGLPPYTYLWYSGTTSNVLPGTNSTTTSVTNLCAGTYNVQIVDATPGPLGPNIVSGIFVITEPSPISGTVVTQTNINCAGGNTGSITFNASGGIAPSGYTYTLSGPSPAVSTSTGAVTFNNLLAGSYTCLISDGSGNFTTVAVTLTTPVAVTTNITTPIPIISGQRIIGCFGSTNGSFTVTPGGGTAPYNLLIVGNSLITPTNTVFVNSYTTSTPITINNLGPGTYTISNNDSNFCTATPQTITFKQYPRLDITRTSPVTTINGYNIRCFGATTGVTFQTSYFSDASTLSPSPQPIMYYLNGVAQPPTVTGLITTKTINMVAGTHTVTAVNTVTNCSASTTVTLTQPPAPLSFVGTPNIDTVFVPVSACTPLCTTGGYGGSCVQAIVNVTGGVGPYTINWRMNGITAWGTGITSNPFCQTNPFNTLQVTVTDANGCTITSSIAV